MIVHRLWNDGDDRVKTCPGDHARHQNEARRKAVQSSVTQTRKAHRPLDNKRLSSSPPIVTFVAVNRVSLVLSQDDSRPLPHLTACVLAARRSLACDEARLAQQHTTRPAIRPLTTARALHQGRLHSQTASQSCTHPRSTLLFALPPARTDADSAIGLSAHAFPRLLRRLPWELKNGLLTG